MLLYIIAFIVLIGIVVTLSLCKAAGRADEWEEQMEYRKDN